MTVSMAARDLRALIAEERSLLRVYDSVMWNLSKEDDEPNSHVISPK